MSSNAEHVVIYYNDLTDSDNWVSALLLELAARKNPAVRIIWVIEPRHVALGLNMTADQRDACIRLIKTHFSKRFPVPFKALLGGLLTPEDLGKLRGVSAEELATLDLAVKPKHGPVSDAVLHGQLMAWDFATFLAESAPESGRPAHVFLDVESLQTADNPVSLNIHHHEELVFRSTRELAGYQSIMDKKSTRESLRGKQEHLRKWYANCTEEQRRRAATTSRASISTLNTKDLAQTIRNAKSVKFFGGSSLGILQRLMGEGVASKMECYLQTGTFDLSKNLFPNQFNIALNIDAAKVVFDQFRVFKRFVIVPSDTTQRVKYELADLSVGNSMLTKRFLGFNCRIDADKIASGGVTIEDLVGKEFAVPDLTAFLCCFSEGFGGVTMTRADFEENRGRQLVLTKQEGGIPVCEIAKEVTMRKGAIDEFFASLTIDADSGIVP